MSRRTAVFIALALAFASQGCGSERTEEAKQSSAAAPVSPNWGARPGYVYGLELGSQAKLPSGNSAFALGLKGELTLEVIGKKADGLHVLARIDQPEMTLGGKVDSEAKRIAEELSEPMLVVLDGGRVKDTRFAPAARAVAISTWRSVLSALQLAEPSAPGATWQSEEYDSTGRFQAEYAKNADGSVLRTKRNYLAMLGGPGAAGAQPGKPKQPEFQPKIISATTRYVVKSAELATVDVKESVLTKLGDQSTLTVENTLTLRVRPNAVPPKLPLDQAAFLARSVHLPPDRAAPRVVGAADAEYDQLKMEGKKFSDIVAHFEQAAKEAAEKKKQAKQQPAAAKAGDDHTPDPEELRETTGAFGSLAAFLRSDESARKEAVAKIRAKSPAAMMLVSGFASAENAASQQILVELLSDRTLPGAIRVRALMGVGRVARPEPTVAPAVVALLDDASVKRQVLLSVGSLSRRLRDAGRDQEAAALRPVLSRELQDPSLPSDRALALRAISNSGDAELLPAVKPYLNDPGAAERGAAAEAIRHMNLPEVNRLLAERLTAESSPEAAQSILRAIRTRGAAPELVAAVSRVIESGPSPNVRQRAIELARSWLRDHPELRAVLAGAAEKDPDPHVRAAAAKAI